MSKFCFTILKSCYVLCSSGQVICSPQVPEVSRKLVDQLKLFLNGKLSFFSIQGSVLQNPELPTYILLIPV